MKCKDVFLSVSGYHEGYNETVRRIKKWGAGRRIQLPVLYEQDFEIRWDSHTFHKT